MIMAVRKILLLHRFTKLGIHDDLEAPRYEWDFGHGIVEFNVPLDTV